MDKSLRGRVCRRARPLHELLDGDDSYTTGLLLAGGLLAALAQLLIGAAIGQ